MKNINISVIANGFLVLYQIMANIFGRLRSLIDGNKKILVAFLKIVNLSSPMVVSDLTQLLLCF